MLSQAQCTRRQGNVASFKRDYTVEQGADVVLRYNTSRDNMRASRPQQHVHCTT